MTKNKEDSVAFAGKTISVTIVDGIEDISLSISYLSEAMECASVAVDSGLADCEDYIEGTLHVLLQAVNAIQERTSDLLDNAMKEMAGA